jgi:hypothetical protein
MTNLASLGPRSKGDRLMRLASVRRMPLRPVSQYHSGPVSGSTFVSALLRASLRERCAMTEQEIEHVAKAIYLVRVAPRRFPRKWDELSVEARRSFEKDAIAAITALDELRGT